MKLLALIVLAVTLQAAGLDGTWSAQTAPPKKKPDQKPLAFTMNLKAEGAKLSGSVDIAAGKKTHPQLVENGKVDGDHATFTTRVHTKKSATTYQWDVTLKNDGLTGIRMRQGAKKGQKFTAKRTA